jgi:sugar-specific transcriptional regulator TrmB
MGSAEMPNKNMATAFLKEFGLDDSEISIYLYIIKTAPQKATTIAKHLRMHKVQVYRLLSNMEKKGVVQVAFEAPKRFAATPLENLLNERIEQLKKAFEDLSRRKDQIVADWRTQRSIAEEDRIETFAVFEGGEKLSAAVDGLRRRARSQLCTLITMKSLVNVNLRGDHDQIMAGKVPFKYRVLTQFDEKKTPNEEMVLKRLCQSKNVEVRITNAHLSPFPGFGLIEDEVVLITQAEKDNSVLSSLWTNNRVIVSLIEKYFEELWRNATDVRMLRQW